MNPGNPETYHFPSTADAPNNPRVPLLLYRQALPDSGEELAELFEATFARHGWPPAWRYWIYDYPHYHSNTHEVIGVYAGSAKVRLGHSAGIETTLRAGDVVIIPAGVVHESLERSADFRGVGAYPDGREPDQFTLSVLEMRRAVARIETVPRPGADPLYGESGPLRALWAR